MTADPLSGSMASSFDDGDTIRVSRLDDGLRVVTETLPRSRSVAVGAWVGVGNRDEPAAIAGVSHFLEHLMFKGSSTRSAQDIAEGIDAVGGDINAFTSKEYTAFHARVPAWELDFGLDTLLDVLTDPGFTADELDAERQVILEELAWSADTADDVVHGVLAESLFPGHPLGWEVLGTAESVRAITVDDVRAFHDRWYRRANMVLAVVGPVDHDEIVARVDAALASRGGGTRPERVRPGNEIIPDVMTHRPIEQAHFAKGWRSGGLHSDDRYALAVATQLLGGGWSSRLFQEVREKRGLSYTVFASVGSYVDSGALSVYAATAPERLAELRSVIDDQLADLAENGPGERELDIARGGFEGATVLGLEDTGSRMARLATNVLIRDRIVGVDEYLDAVRRVTASDVQRAITDIVTEASSVSVVGPR
ncbi:MAG: pitrilysin family protein [Actinomycetota bacterium]